MVGDYPQSEYQSEQLGFLVGPRGESAFLNLHLTSRAAGAARLPLACFLIIVRLFRAFAVAIGALKISHYGPAALSGAGRAGPVCEEQIGVLAALKLEDLGIIQELAPIPAAIEIKRH